ncbi:hypothetical protein Trydic_g2499 [Trypoxylus dichotomus]
MVISQLDKVLEELGDELRYLRLSSRGPNVQSTLLDEDVETYDFIVIGAGSAGAVVASRLSENLSWRVLLIEAGPSELLIGQIPLVGAILRSSQYAWTYKTTPQKYSCFGTESHQCYIKTGKGLGGGSIVNAMNYARGNKADFDYWASTGNPGWSYDEVLPYFKKPENVRLQNYEPGYHQKGGPLNVEDNNHITEQSRAFVKAAEELGYKLADYNGENSSGIVSHGQFITRNGERLSTSKAYLEPVRFRKNLVIKTYSHAIKLNFDSKKKATSVLYERNNRHLIARARKEIIVSCGALNSPQLLMVSGIGPEDHLRKLGIPVVQNLRVGYNLRDHYCFLGLDFYYDYNQTQNVVQDSLDWVFHRKGALAGAGLDAQAFFSTNGLNYPNFELILVSSAASIGYKLAKIQLNIDKAVYDSIWQPMEGRKGFIIGMILLTPKSIGRVKIQSNTTFIPPLVDVNYLSEPEDIENLIKAIRKTLAFQQTQSFKRLNVKLNSLKPVGCQAHEFDSDAYWACVLRIIHTSSFHYHGTCKMGPSNDPEAVVDNELRVHGVTGLRVVDASVIPAHSTAHLEAPTVMIAEKASDLIKRAWDNNSEKN